MNTRKNIYKIESRLSLIVALTLLLGINSCKKEDEIPPNPVIEFVGSSSTEVISFQNTVTLSISYEDQQGDIGESDPDINTVKVKDSRLDEADWYHIPPITPDNTELITTGQFTIELPTLFLLGNGSEESTTFSVQIQDRAGNLSNTVVSPAITILEE